MVLRDERLAGVQVAHRGTRMLKQAFWRDCVRARGPGRGTTVQPMLHVEGRFGGEPHPLRMMIELGDGAMFSACVMMNGICLLLPKSTEREDTICNFFLFLFPSLTRTNPGWRPILTARWSTSWYYSMRDS